MKPMNNLLIPSYGFKAGVAAFALVLLIFIGCSRKGKANHSQADNQMAKLEGVWLHSYEDEAGRGEKCYRPKSYAFPPARGRGGLRFDKDGKMAELRIAPNDAGHVEYPGKYQFEADGKTMNITMDDGRKLKWELVSLANGLMKIKENQP
jgi:hypothetical protein